MINGKILVEKLIVYAKNFLHLNDLDEIERYNLEKYIDDNNITLTMVSKYCSFFPDYVSKRVLSSELIKKFK